MTTSTCHCEITVVGVKGGVSSKVKLGDYFNSHWISLCFVLMFVRFLWQLSETHFFSSFYIFPVGISLGYPTPKQTRRTGTINFGCETLFKSLSLSMCLIIGEHVARRGGRSKDNIHEATLRYRMFSSFITLLTWSKQKGKDPED